MTGARRGVIGIVVWAGCGSGADGGDPVDAPRPVDASGGIDAPATPDGPPSIDAPASPDGTPPGAIALRSDDGGVISLYTMASDGSGLAAFPGTLPGDSDPAWSADGTRIAFSRSVAGQRDIFVADADGTDAVNLTADAASDSSPAWSPDGMRLAFYSDRGGGQAIYVMDADGTDVVHLADTGFLSRPAWSPDGVRIAFGRWPLADNTMRVWVANASGGGLTRLGPPPDEDNLYFDFDPAWSPDGTRLAFVSDRADAAFEVFVMTAAGTNPVRLTDQNGATYSQSPAWSPDGSAIVFVSDRDGDNEIFVMSADGSGETPVTANTADDVGPAWR